MMERLVETARWMKPGARIITYTPFPGPEFVELGEIREPTSWSGNTCWKVQEVVRNPPEGSSRPAALRRSDEFEKDKRCCFVEK